MRRPGHVIEDELIDNRDHAEDLREDENGEQLLKLLKVLPPRRQ